MGFGMPDLRFRGCPNNPKSGAYDYDRSFMSSWVLTNSRELQVPKPSDYLEGQGRKAFGIGLRILGSRLPGLGPKAFSPPFVNRL